MRISIGSDHAGYALKTQVARWLTDAGHVVTDHGPSAPERCDYPDYAHLVAAAVASGEAERGVLICGTGIGMAMSANRHPGVRAARCTSVFDAEATRAHNDANLLCLGERITGLGVAERVLQAFFATPFEGGRHQARIDKITPTS